MLASHILLSKVIDSKLKYSTDPARKDCPAQYLEKDSPAQRVADIKAVLDAVRKTVNTRHLSSWAAVKGPLSPIW